MSLFKKKTTKEKVAEQVEPLAERAAEAGAHLGNLVKDTLSAAISWAEPRAKEAADRIQPLAIDAYDKAVPYVKDAVDKANVVAHDAVVKARPYVEDAFEKANVVAHDAVVKARPYVEDAAKRYEETADLVRDDYLPRAKRAAQAALDEARTGSGDLQTRANAVVKVSKKELAKPTKKRRRGKWLGFLVVASAGAAAAYVAWARSKPVQDPWAEAYWEDVSVPEADDEVTNKVDDVVEEPAEAVAEDEALVPEEAQPSEEELKAEELDEHIAKTREEEAAAAAGLIKDEDK
ncbi:hypothetical protein [Trueperella pecoris]|uniref:Apolipoprotein A1/A4/E domain protein n=1 Tax=Trueperella pecoris TaxID=2733571 RepID=A0A7M1QW01_9ACTO|nr:hypothetical protein [Trueperella pecoris]QOR45674.1 hypothetical protein INS88_00065 [Trueperella pecoris]QTG75515.1 hypothetical protein J4179_00065 [Trueperella pecoris]